MIPDNDELKEILPRLSDGEFSKVCELFAATAETIKRFEEQGDLISSLSKLLVEAAEKIQLLEHRVKELENKTRWSV